MLDVYLEIFYTTAEQFAPLIIPVLAVYLILNLFGSLLFKD